MPENPQTSRSELISIQLLRAIASLMVLLAHLQIKEKQYGDTNSLIWQSFHIGSAGVDIFFVLSGFIIFHVAGNSDSTWPKAWAFMKHRIIRVMPLYWLLTTVALIIFLASPELVNKNSSKPTDILGSFLLLPTGNKLLIQNGWTLSYEFLFYGVFFLAILFLSSRKRALAVSSAAVCAAACGLLLDFNSIFSKFLTDDLLLEFAYGVLIAAFFHSRFYRIIFNRKVGFIVLFTSLTAFVCAALIPFNVSKFRGIAFGLPAALLIVSMLSLEPYLARFKNLKIFGDSSYSLYLLHVLSLPAVGMLWRKLGLEGSFANFALLMTLFVSSVAASIILYRFFELPTTRYLRRRWG